MIGIIVALGALMGGTVIEGGSPAAYLNISAILIIFGGTFGATIASYDMPTFMRFPKLFGLAIKARQSNAAELKAKLVTFAERARREGLLALEADVDEVDDPFVRRGLQMVIDGLEPDTVEEILELEVEAMQRRHNDGAAIFTSMGGYAPTMGVIGTVMGLVNVLSHLDDPSGLGASIAVAFIATLIGVGSANIVWLPIGQALKAKSAAEVTERRMAIVAILAIQAGDNPRIVAQKLASFSVHDVAKDDTPAEAMKPAAATTPAEAA
jgi:chemotaxis protein MotA